MKMNTNIGEITKCRIHFGDLNDPIVLKCQHAFCRTCIIEYVRAQACTPKRCFECEEPICYDINTLERLQASLLHKELVEGLKKKKRRTAITKKQNIENASNCNTLFSAQNFKTIKISLVGNSGSGKTSLIRRLEGFGFSVPAVTIPSDIHTVNIVDNEHQLTKVFIWDTAGSDTFRTVIRSHYVKSDGIIVVYDVSDEQSFIDIEYWLNEIRNHVNNEELIILVIGNKIDRVRNVAQERAQLLIDRHNLLYIETSAKTGKNVLEAIHGLVNKINSYVRFKNIGSDANTLTVALRNESGSQNTNVKMKPMCTCSLS